MTKNSMATIISRRIGLSPLFLILRFATVSPDFQTDVIIADTAKNSYLLYDGSEMKTALDFRNLNLFRIYTFLIPVYSILRDNQLLFPQAVVHKFCKEYIETGSCRYRHNHAKYAPQITEYKDA